jgi:hypothetical protein
LPSGEGPLLEAAVRALPAQPDVLLVDATGRDHPRRGGLALHLGAALDLPTVGVTHRPPVAEEERLDWFFDAFLERPELQELRDGKVAADLLLKALQKAIDAAPRELRFSILKMSDERRGEMPDDVGDETELL